MNSTLLFVIAAVLVIMNFVSFFLMWKDKNAAKNGKWRIKERTLFLATALFGGLGGVMGMYILRHKTQHWYFKLFFPIFLILQIAILIFIGIKFF